jgi:hypothetical protein
MLLIAAVSLWCWAGSLPREDAKSGGSWLAGDSKRVHIRQH